MKKNPKLILFIILSFISFSLQDRYYDIEEVFEYLDEQGYNTEEEYNEVIRNISKIFKDSYAFYDISKNPPQPFFDKDYHSKIDIQEKLNEIDVSNINSYELYRRIMTVLSELRDAHIVISFLDFDFKEFYVTSPFDYVIGADENGKPRIFVECIDSIIDYFDDSYNIKSICDGYTSLPVETINGQDPFEYILNLGGNVRSNF